MTKSLFALANFNSCKIHNTSSLRGGTKWGDCVGSRVTDAGTTYLDIAWDDGSPDSCNVNHGGGDGSEDSWLGARIFS